MPRNTEDMTKKEGGKRKKGFKIHEKWREREQSKFRMLRAIFRKPRGVGHKKRAFEGEFWLNFEETPEGNSACFRPFLWGGKRMRANIISGLFFFINGF